MAELTKLVKIIQTSVREVVREELSFMKKDILMELQKYDNTDAINIRENRIQNSSNKNNDKNIINIDVKPNIIKSNGGGGQMSLLQQMAFDKMRNPDDEFLAMKTMS